MIQLRHPPTSTANSFLADATVAVKSQYNPDRENTYLHGEHGGNILSAPLSKLRSEHPEQTTENRKPAHERHHHRPATRPTIVGADDCKAGNKQ